MKTARFLFRLIGCGVLALGMGFAGEPARQPSEPDSHGNHAASAPPADRVHGNTDQMDEGHSKFTEDGRTSEMSGLAGSLNARSKSTPVNPLHQPGWTKAATGANVGLLMNRIGNRRQPLAKPPVGGGITMPLPGALRGRGAATAVIGGAAASSAKNSAAALNGAAMKRKP
jgi:hypothetical protein